MMTVWDDDADDRVEDDLVEWEEIEECVGPEYLMWRDRLDALSEVPVRRASTLVIAEKWREQIC